MSLESAKSFMERVRTDEVFAKQVRECEDGDSRMALAIAQGFDFTAQEMEEAKKELSNEELDSIAGGQDDCPKDQPIDFPIIVSK